MNHKEETRVSEGASWFKDEFGLLAKGSKQKKIRCPRGSVQPRWRWISQNNSRPSQRADRAARYATQEVEGEGDRDLAQTPPKKEKGKEGKGEVTDLTSKANRDSASQLGNTSLSSEEGKEVDEDSLGDKEGSCSKTSNEGENYLSATGSR